MDRVMGAHLPSRGAARMIGLASFGCGSPAPQEAPVARKQLSPKTRQARLKLLTEYRAVEDLLSHLYAARHEIDGAPWAARRVLAPFGKDVRDLVAQVFLRREALRAKLDKLLGIKDEDYDG